MKYSLGMVIICVGLAIGMAGAVVYLAIKPTFGI